MNSFLMRFLFLFFLIHILEMLVLSTDSKGHPITVQTWKCSTLTTYQSGAARLSPLLGWVERCTIDMASQQTWKTVNFDDSKWTDPLKVGSNIPPPIDLLSLNVTPASSVEGTLNQIDNGTFVERFGYAKDDYAARFSLRLLTSTSRSCQSITKVKQHKHLDKLSDKYLWTAHLRLCACANCKNNHFAFADHLAWIFFLMTIITIVLIAVSCSMHDYWNFFGF